MADLNYLPHRASIDLLKSHKKNQADYLCFMHLMRQMNSRQCQAEGWGQGGHFFKYFYYDSPEKLRKKDFWVEGEQQIIARQKKKCLLQTATLPVYQTCVCVSACMCVSSKTLFPLLTTCTTPSLWPCNIHPSHFNSSLSLLIHTYTHRKTHKHT